eukprot:scaffold42683_cov60-Phaeocystis_antarctica.AAC.1
MLHERYGESDVVPPFHTWCHTKRKRREMRYLSHTLPSGSHVPGGTSRTRRGPRWAKQCAGRGHRPLSKVTKPRATERRAAPRWRSCGRYPSASSRRQGSHRSVRAGRRARVRSSAAPRRLRRHSTARGAPGPWPQQEGAERAGEGARARAGRSGAGWRRDASARVAWVRRRGQAGMRCAPCRARQNAQTRRARRLGGVWRGIP